MTQQPPDIFDHASASQPDAFDVTTTKFVVCSPKYLSTRIKNNVLMEGEEAGEPDVPRALRQWDRMVKTFRSLGVDVVEMPAPPTCQDATFCSNVAASIPPYIILANFSAPGRKCEEAPARAFFESLGYPVIQPPFPFEGFAELKPLRGNIYLGGYGQFTARLAYPWIEQKCGIKVIPLLETSPRQYHLDCGLLVINEENVLVSETAFDKASLGLISKVANITFTPKELGWLGLTNGILIPERPIYLSGMFQLEEPGYRQSMEWLLATMDKFGLSTLFLDTDAIGPSGGALSCQMMPLTF